MGTARGLTVLRATGVGVRARLRLRRRAPAVRARCWRAGRGGAHRCRGQRALAAAALGLAPESGETDHAVRHALLRILTGHAAETPILLAIDDLELVDSQSLDFLRYVAQRQAQHRIVAVAALNQGNGGAGEPPIGLLHIQQAAQVMRLEPLDAGGVAKLLAASGRPASPALCVELVRVTGGNPFLLNSVIRSFRPRGAGGRAGGGHARPGAAARAPPGRGAAARPHRRGPRRRSVGGHRGGGHGSPAGGRARRDRLARRGGLCCGAAG